MEDGCAPRVSLFAPALFIIPHYQLFEGPWSAEGSLGSA